MGADDRGNPLRRVGHPWQGQLVANPGDEEHQGDTQHHDHHPREQAEAPVRAVRTPLTPCIATGPMELGRVAAPGMLRNERHPPGYGAGEPACGRGPVPEGTAASPLDAQRLLVQAAPSTAISKWPPLPRGAV